MRVLDTYSSKKIPIYLLLLIFLSIKAQSQNLFVGINDLKRYQLNGPVKLLVRQILEYPSKEGADVSHLVQTNKIWFNAQGNCTSVVKYDSIGALAFTEKYAYNAQGRLLSAKCYDGPRKKKSETEYRYYNDQGKCILRKAFNWEERSFSQDSFSYDRAGRCVRELSAEADLPLLPTYKAKYTHEIKYEYDSLGRLSKANKFNDFKKDAYVIVNYYYLENIDSCVVNWRDKSYAIEIINKTGQPLRRYNYNELGKLEGWSSCVLNEYGMLISQESYYQNKLISDFKCTYFDIDKFNNFGTAQYMNDGRLTQQRIQKVIYR